VLGIIAWEAAANVHGIVHHAWYLQAVLYSMSWFGMQRQCMALCAMAGSFMLCCAVRGVMVWDAVPLAWQRALYLAASCCPVLCCVSHSILQFPGARGCQARLSSSSFFSSFS